MMIIRLFLALTLVICLVIALCPIATIAKRMSAYAGTLGTSFTYLKAPYALINVSDYTGETDYERIQKALNDVTPEGATVFIPEGTWEACNLSAISNTIILGTNGTLLRRPQNTTAPFITFQNQTNFAVLSITFDGQNVTDASGIQIVNGTDFCVVGNVFQDVARHALYIAGQCQNFSVENNVFLHATEAPLLIFGSPSVRIINGFLVANNTLMMSDNNGKIGVAFAANGTVADNYLYNCTYGIATRCVSDLVIRDNRIENCASYGVYLGTQPGDVGSDNISIIENYISGSDVGIARYYGSGSMVNITVRNNTIVNSIQSDIYADFQGFFVNNTLTSKDKVRLLTIPYQFSGNVDLNMTLMIPADVQGDGKVNMRDVGIVARLFQSSLGSDNWNPAADVIQNNVIDMKDVSYVVKCFSS
jgi:hypothetical protein